MECRVNFYFAALGETIHIPAKGRGQSRDVEERRMEQVGDGTNFAGNLFHYIAFSETALCPAESSLSDCDRTTAIFMPIAASNWTHAVVQFRAMRFVRHACIR